MHPLRLLLIVSLAVAAAIGIAFGALLARGGVPQTEAYVIGAIVLGAFMLPWSGVFLWAVRRASDLETLIDRTRFLVRDEQRSIANRRYHGEVDDLARAIEEIRLEVVREKSWAAEQRTTLEQITASLGEGLLALTPQSPPREFAELLRTISERRIIVVGHEPNLTANMLALCGLTNAGSRLALQRGGCYAVRIHGEEEGVLEWLLSPRILRKLAE